MHLVFNMCLECIRRPHGETSTISKSVLNKISKLVVRSFLLLRFGWPEEPFQFYKMTLGSDTGKIRSIEEHCPHCPLLASDPCRVCDYSWWLRQLVTCRRGSGAKLRLMHIISSPRALSQHTFCFSWSSGCKVSQAFKVKGSCQILVSNSCGKGYTTSLSMTHRDWTLEQWPWELMSFEDWRGQVQSSFVDKSHNNDFYFLYLTFTGQCVLYSDGLKESQKGRKWPPRKKKKDNFLIWRHKTSLTEQPQCWTWPHIECWISTDLLVTLQSIIVHHSSDMCQGIDEGTKAPNKGWALALESNWDITLTLVNHPETRLHCEILSVKYPKFNVYHLFPDYKSHKYSLLKI